MAILNITRSVTINSTTNYGDNVTISKVTSEIAEDITKQIISSETLDYTTSSPYAAGSLKVYLNGVMLSKDKDWEEVGSQSFRLLIDSFDVADHSPFLYVIYYAK